MKNNDVNDLLLSENDVREQLCFHYFRLLCDACFRHRKISMNKQ